MAGILARSNVTRQAQISAKRLVAKDLAFNVESLRGSDTGTGSSIAKTKLVDAKLEMVRSGWLFQYCAVIRRFCLLSGLDRIQRNKIDQCLQRCAGPGQGSPAVIEVLGSPITDGFLVSGNTNVNGASGEANLSIPVSGPKGKGTIYAAATKSLGRWNYSGLVLEIEKTHQRINLLEEPAPVSSR